jgi:uncharacterized protein (DUF433 family)
LDLSPWFDNRFVGLLMIIDHRIPGTRITASDVLHHLENDRPLEEIAEVLGLSDRQVQAAVD